MTNPSKFTWVIPTTNTDGSPITTGELTGFSLGVGTASGNYTIITPISSPTATSEPLASLSQVLVPGTYFAAIKADTASGASAYSNEVTFTIVPPIPSPPTGFSVS